MGLFSTVFGGPSKSNSQSSSQSGYSILPQFAKNTLANLDTGINSINASQFTPLQTTADEQKAFEQLRYGYTPTSESIASDISMQQNPYNQYVIDEINRQSGGQNSVLQQNLNSAGQFGSNRQMLGANDIDLSRQNQIGGFLQSQFNTSLNNALTTLPALRAQDTQGLLGIGNFQRDLNAQTLQAPVNALNAQSGIASGLGYTVGGSNSNSYSGAIGEQKGIIGSLGGLFSGLGAMSDERLKDNITYLGKENGHKIYKYSYKGSDAKFIGVMAQDVKETNPFAVIDVDGYMAVNYDLIGVKLRKAA